MLEANWSNLPGKEKIKLLKNKGYIELESFSIIYLELFATYRIPILINLDTRIESEQIIYMLNLSPHPTK